MITSGNIISVANALSIGGFDNDLFIDEVDYDFCYKGMRAGFKSLKNKQGIYLVHRLGNTFNRRFLGHTFICMNHNKIRKYYIMRNRMEMVRRYHDLFGVKFVLMYLKSNARLIFDIVFFEEDKLARLRYALLGFCDFVRGRLGKRV